MFKKFSESNTEKYQEFIGLQNIWRNIEELDIEQRSYIYDNLENYLFNTIECDEVITLIEEINKDYLQKDLANNYIKTLGYGPGDRLWGAKKDIKNIILFESSLIFLDLLSNYLILIQYNKEKFVKDKLFIDNLLKQFNINYQIINNEFIPRQGKYIIEEIYSPILEKLSHERFQPSDRDFKDALIDYKKGDYSGTITKTVSSIEGALQILVYGKIGKGTFGDLVSEAQRIKKISDDEFSKGIIKTLQQAMSIWRKENGDAHSKKDYATENNAKLVLNLGAVFLQHIL